MGLGEALTCALAHNYHRLLAVKDEWEVARLYSHPGFKAALEREFEGAYRVHFHIGAWPFAKTNAKSGKIAKGEVGPWLMFVFKWTARWKGLRGKLLDPFRGNPERRLEKSLLAQYEDDINGLLEVLDPVSLPLATKLAGLPQTIRGYGHVKETQATKAAAARAGLFVELAAARKCAAQQQIGSALERAEFNA